jgi:hypothetical protein
MGENTKKAWRKMRIPGGRQGDPLPGDRGRYLLWLEPPVVEGAGHFVHFSWKEEAFCIRDYLHQIELRQYRGATALDIWKAASERIPAKGELYIPVDNFEFWTAKLGELTESRKRGKSITWARLSSKFVPRSEEDHVDEGGAQIVMGASQDATDNRKENEPDSDPYSRFKSVWRKSVGFDLVDGTVGCSARHEGVPLLWVFPTYFRIAPSGKGNIRHDDVRYLRDRHFPLQTKGIVHFDSAQFSWDRFQSFIADVQGTMTDPARIPR